MAGKEPKKWMQELNIKKDALRAKAKRAGGMKKSTDTIKESFLVKAKKSSNPKTRKQAVLAETFKKASKK